MSKELRERLVRFGLRTRKTRKRGVSDFLLRLKNWKKSRSAQMDVHYEFATLHLIKIDLNLFLFFVSRIAGME